MGISEPARGSQADLETARRTAAERRRLETAVREIEQRVERLMQALLVGGQAPTLIVQRLRQEEAALKATRERLAAVGTTVEPAPLAVVRETIRTALVAGGQDLRRLRPVIERIDLPADPTALPIMRALGGRWVLALPKKTRFGRGFKNHG